MIIFHNFIYFFIATLFSLIEHFFDLVTWSDTSFRHIFIYFFIKFWKLRFKALVLILWLLSRLILILPQTFSQLLLHIVDSHSVSVLLLKNALLFFDRAAPHIWFHVYLWWIQLLIKLFSFFIFSSLNLLQGRHFFSTRFTVFYKDIKIKLIWIQYIFVI